MTAEPRTLVLLRHAKAEHSHGTTDEERTLTGTGRSQARAVGGRFAADRLHPDRVICSVAMRTRQTWEHVAAELGAVPPVVEFSDDLYGSGVSGTLEIIRGVDPDVRTLLLVGHEPVMSGVAYLLAGPGSIESAVARVRVGVPTGAYSVVRLGVPWGQLARGAGLLTKVVAPAQH